MNSANVDTSSRLQRVLHVLLDGRPHSTMELIRRCNVCAVNSIVSELRRNGHHISCRRDSHTEQGRRGPRWLYQLTDAIRKATRVELPKTIYRPAVTLIYA